MNDWGTEGKMNPFKEVYDVGVHLFIECVCTDYNLARVSNDCPDGQLQRVI
jgi:hypothetical protein